MSLYITPHILFSASQTEVLQDLEKITKTDSVKESAFQILSNKCNECHVKRNRKRLFTKNNMDNWADDVYNQVFIKRRMPKGNKIKLSAQDYQNLLTWISSTKI